MAGARSFVLGKENIMRRERARCCVETLRVCDVARGEKSTVIVASIS